MKGDKLELLEKWHMTITLMGIDFEDIFDDYDDGSLYERIREEEIRNERLANPNEITKAVLQTIEMGVTSDDIEDYESHLENVRMAREKQERIDRERNNVELKKLNEEFAFELTQAKQYPSHRHFKFKDANDIEYRGRLFHPSWGQTRIWLSWKDKKGKQQFRWDARSSGLTVPRTFPHEWQEWGYTSNLDRVAHVVAYWVTSRKMPKDANFTYPKK